METKSEATVDNNAQLTTLPRNRKQWLTYLKANAKTIVVVLVVITLASAYFHQTQINNALKQQGTHSLNSQAAARSEAVNLRNEVGQLLQLPTNELPTVATVSDVSKLQNQAFFANAKDGDKVLLFSKAKEAVLYRPSDNKIIEVAPISPGGASSSAGSSASSSLGSQ